jgi:hypothetical protein
MMVRAGNPLNDQDADPKYLGSVILRRLAAP